MRIHSTQSAALKAWFPAAIGFNDLAGLVFCTISDIVVAIAGISGIWSYLNQEYLNPMFIFHHLAGSNSSSR